MKILLTSLFLFPLYSAFALHTPPAIDAGAGRSGKAIFVDFERAHYQITYNPELKKTVAKSSIHFRQTEAGLPLFDLVPEPRQVRLNGKEVSVSAFTISSVTTLRIIDQVLAPGEYDLEMENDITQNITYTWEGDVKNAFWMSDLDDRSFLEQYIPSNLEYDQYAMEFEVKIESAKKEYDLITNGQIERRGLNDFHVTYPPYFNTSSIFYHLMPKGAIPKIEEKYTTLDGREIPFIVYSSGSISSFKQTALNTLRELERDYGPWPHQKVIIYGGKYGGGMEYCGATETDLSALPHELTHSYFARGVMPAQGNAGWIDEAMASWRDGGYQQYEETSLNVTQMAGHSVYQRKTDRAAYSSGMRFLGHLDKKFKEQGGLKKFMRFYFEKNVFNPYLTQTFESLLHEYFNNDVEALFKKYIYGTLVTEQGQLPIKSFKNENPMHKILSKQELLELL